MSESQSPQKEFKDLTLWQVLRLFLYHPRATARRFIADTTLPSENTVSNTTEQPETIDETGQEWHDTQFDILPSLEPTDPITTDSVDSIRQADVQNDFANAVPKRPYRRLLIGLLVALVVAVIGALQLWAAANDPQKVVAGDSNGAMIWFFIAAAIYIGVMLYQSQAWWRNQWQRRANQSVDIDQVQSSESTEDELSASQSNDVVAAPSTRFFDMIDRNTGRMILMPFGVILAYLAYTENTVYTLEGQLSTVRFTTSGTWAWLLAILVWFLILAVDINKRTAQLLYWLRSGMSLPNISFQMNWHNAIKWQHIALLFIMILAIYFRFNDLGAVPPEMTSDHIEKLLDARRVYNGYTAVFFDNNGGREAFQMHFIAFLVRFGGQDFSFNTLKLASGIEGLLTVFLGYWLGKVIMGNYTHEDRKMGIWLGVSFALLLAISSWHVMLSRLGLRIALTPLTTLLVFIFLARGMRDNRSINFVLMGVCLGAGTYFYQANRMLPLVAIAGTILAIMINARSWNDAFRYAVNLGSAGIIAVVIFLPMYRYSQEFPNEFWNRTRGRIFGENAFVRTNPETGFQENYEPSYSEQLERMLEESSQFRQNYQDALLMWGWEGDSAWINNGESRPALDPYTNALFILGIAGWSVLFFKRWDVVLLLVPVGILIMLLPSALTLAYTIENPSFTRASGTIPFVFLIAAYPLAQLGFFAQHTPKMNWLGLTLAGMLILPVTTFAAQINYDTFFNVYERVYANSWKPYSRIAQPMQEFATGQGSYGNAFMIAYPHWLDHRILAVSAGDINWDNGLVQRDGVFNKIFQNEGTPYAYDPALPTFFMYHQEDNESADWLRQLFPDGEIYEYQFPDDEGLDFYYFIAPPNIDWPATQELAMQLIPPE